MQVFERSKIDILKNRQYIKKTYLNLSGTLVTCFKFKKRLIKVKITSIN